jgi:hypothetical protein
VIDWGQLTIALRGTDMITFASRHDYSLMQVYENIIIPLCKSYPIKHKQMISALIIDFIFKKSYSMSEASCLERDVEQALKYLKDIHEMH